VSRPSTPNLITPGVIANRLRAPLHRILYVLSTREHIKPAARVGTVRVYDKAAVEAVRQELNAITAARLLKGVPA
jgi:hypothetical protein